MYTTELKGDYTPKFWVEEEFAEIKEITDFLTLTDETVLPSQVLGYSVREFNLSADARYTYSR